MPTTDFYVNTGQTAGTQCSSGGEGRVLSFEESVITHPTHTDGFVDGKDPVVIGTDDDGYIVGVAMSGASATTDKISVDTEGLWWLNVVASDDEGTSAIRRGDRIYINTTTCVLSKIRSAATQVLFGQALGVLDASASAAVLAVKVHQDPTWEALGYDNDTFIWVSPDGDDDGDGSFLFPYLTLAVAFAAVTSAKKTIMLMPGTYTSAASLAFPTGVTDVLVTGLTTDYESTIIDCTVGDEAILVKPSVVIGAANYLAYFANLTISSGAENVDGIRIDNTNMTASKKLIVTFRDCGFSNDTDTDYSLVTNHADDDSLIKIYMHGRGMGGNNIEGLVYIDTANIGDRFKANGMNFEGGVQFSTDTVACENEFYNCVMKLNGGSGGQDTQQLRANCCISRDGMTQAIAALGDFADNADEAFLSLA